MTMNEDQRRIQQKLDEELQNIVFTQSDSVLKKLQPKKPREHLKDFWNKEIDIPLFPVAVITVLLFSMIGMNDLNHSRVNVRKPEITTQLIDVGGNTYRKSDYEKVVNRIENKGKG